MSCVSRTPPLTLLHLSASKFSDAPSSGGIAGFLSAGVAPGRSVFATSKVSTPPASELKQDSACKQRGSIQAFFQKAPVKQKGVRMDVEEEIPPLSGTSPTCTDDSQLQTAACSSESLPQSKLSSGFCSFFHKKTLEKSKHEPQNNPGSSENNESKAAETAGAEPQSKRSSELTPHHQPHAEDSDPESNCNRTSVAAEDLLKCDRCGQEVLVWEMPEHNDYHFALDLQNSISSSTGSSSSSGSPAPLRGSVQHPQGKTKTRGQFGPAAKRPRSQGGSKGTLDSFFTKN